MRTTPRPEPATWPNTGITGSCLGHSTVLMNFLGVRVLTDPVFSARVGIGRAPLILGPKRYLRPALRPGDFAAPDVIVLSHAHFDHLDVSSLRKFPRETPIVTAENTGDLLRLLRFREIHELPWGKSIELSPRGERIRITGLEVAHWGARLLRDHHRGFNAYLLERGGHTVCFGGDTAYTDAFAELHQPRRPLNLMIMPVGAYNPWIRAHCTPEQALVMAQQAGAATFVPIHHQTFKLGAEPMDEPGKRVRHALAHQPERLLAVNVGETVRVPLVEPGRYQPLRLKQRLAA